MQINITDTSAKAAARYIRQKTGVDVPHSTILQGIAVAGGYASWQAMSAALRNDTMVPNLPETEASQPAQQDKSVYGMVYADLDRGAAWELFRWSCKTIWLSRNDPARHDEWKRMMEDYQRPKQMNNTNKNSNQKNINQNILAIQLECIKRNINTEFISTHQRDPLIQNTRNIKRENTNDAS